MELGLYTDSVERLSFTEALDLAARARGVAEGTLRSGPYGLWIAGAAVTMGGGIWSEQPASRFVLIGGQVMREGDSPVPGVQVERIEIGRAHV